MSEQIEEKEEMICPEENFLDAKFLLNMAEKPKIEKVFVKEINKHVFIKIFTGMERANLEAETAKLKRTHGHSILKHRHFILQKGLCDQEGLPLFSDNEMSKLKQLPGDIADVLAVVIMKANGLHEDSLEDAEKN